MCGIFGVIYKDHNRSISVDHLKEGTDIIKHRGPDDEGYFVNGNIGLGFRRLSIIDLNKGNQPISNENETIWVIMNGEIYNYTELRIMLKYRGHKFKTEGDTEVLVHLYEEYGLKFCEKIRGMFSIALYDKQKNKLLLVRDRLGIKPLFFEFTTDSFVFSSEIKQIKIFKKINYEINSTSAMDYFSYGYVLGSQTIFRGISRLLPAHQLVIDINSFKYNISSYWKLEGLSDYNYSESDCIALLNEKLEESVKLHMSADVPLGAFLSGGIDSSAVVSKMAKFSNKPIKTFTIGFREKEYSELSYARSISKLFATEHYELILSPSTSNIIDEVIKIFDEPFSDSSSIPTYLLTKFIKEHVKVALSGDGGDELFAGYANYKKYNKIREFSYNSPFNMKFMFTLANKILPDYMWGKGITYYLTKDINYLYSYFTTFKDDETSKIFNTDFLKDINGYSSIMEKQKMLNSYSSSEPTKRNQLLDIQSYLVDDILTKVDRTSMKNSLEVRVPLLDHEFVETALRIPLKYKLNQSEGKIIFKKAFTGELPQNILKRKKKGFSIPLKKWLNGEFDSIIIDELLGKNKTINAYINNSFVEKLIHRHRKGIRDYSSQIWSLLVFSKWLNQNQ